MHSWYLCLLVLEPLESLAKAYATKEHGGNSWCLIQHDHSLLQLSVPLVEDYGNKTLEKQRKEAEKRNDAKKKKVAEKRKAAQNRLKNEDNPFWELNFGHELIHRWPQLLLCSFLLLLSGMLCASAGIGGNIIQVTVLMAAGNITPADAVPLSKVVILLGALGSLVVHTSYKAWNGKALRAPLICWDSCRVAVPACLLGTSLGVAVNPRVPDSLLVFILAVFLFCIAVWVVRETWHMRNAELSLSSSVRDGSSNSRSSGDDAAAELTPDPTPSATGNVIIGMVLLLMLVVACGLVRELTENCHDAAFYLSWNAKEEHCNHPFLKIMFLGKVHSLWFITHSTSVTVLCTALPVLVCFTYGSAAAYKADTSMPRSHIASIQLVVFMLGFLGALTGIGGGVVLSPFFLMLGLSVQRTVATSVVCVIFISASSALQYIITNRVRMALALILGCVNAVGSCAGAILMYKMAGAWARSSFIMAIISFAVICSFAITLEKLIVMML